ncbi:ATP synthase subunit delta, mitochondrial-like [Talpa occidentalis]|uniref:ATP synthase subunit delta, mitochondrial-like n=1 Tax=Talpa occidentalis TaxID=50954 RepID=UPI00188FE439|nr:ATP synthase subunit delta, mitochondrial-like [Talpa occidentalis]
MAASSGQVSFKGPDVQQIDVPTQTGSLGILAAPCLPAVPAGLVVVSVLRTAPPPQNTLITSEVNADSSVQLLAEEAVTSHGLSLGTANVDLENVQSELVGAMEAASRVDIQIRMEASMAW